MVMRRHNLVQHPPLFQFCFYNPIIRYGTNTSENILRSELVQIFTVHSGHAIGEDDSTVIFVKGCESRVLNTRVGINPHKEIILYVESIYKVLETGSSNY